MTGIKPEFLILDLANHQELGKISLKTSAESQALPSSLPVPREGPFLGGKGGWDELIWVYLPLLAVDSFVSIRFPATDSLLQLQSPGVMQGFLGSQISSGKWKIWDRPEPIPGWVLSVPAQ